MREDESLFADIPANGGTFGYCLLKGLHLPIDCPTDKLVAPAAQLAHDLAMVIDFTSLFLFFSFLFFSHSLLQANNSATKLITQYVEYQRVVESAGLTAKDLEAARDAS